MEQEQAERFLAAAQQDYHEAVERFIQCVPREEFVLRCDERADVLAARQVLELAQREAQQSRRTAQQDDPVRIDEGGPCEGCAEPVQPVFFWRQRYLCADCRFEEQMAERR